METEEKKIKVEISQLENETVHMKHPRRVQREKKIQVFFSPNLIKNKQEKYEYT